MIEIILCLKFKFNKKNHFIFEYSKEEQWEQEVLNYNKSSHLAVTEKLIMKMKLKREELFNVILKKKF